VRAPLDPESAACILAVVLGLVAFAIMIAAQSLPSLPRPSGVIGAAAPVVVAT
jgi:hypothetical protein